MADRAAALLLIALLLIGVASSSADEARYGVCRQEIVDYVENTLGHTPTRVEIQQYAGSTPFSLGSALVFVNECDGFHAFAISATESVCEHIPHYGQTNGSFVHYEGAFEQCRQR